MNLSSTNGQSLAVAEHFGHRAHPGLFDEMTEPDGQVRSHWRPFVESLGSLGLSKLIRRWHDAKHLIRENGVTYNVYGDPRGMDRPWQLDPIPLLLAPADADALERGLVQRARLLE